MQIQKTCYQPAFHARFTNNEAFRNVVRYAQENDCMRTLDGALNTLRKVDAGTITIYHGRTADGTIYSNFTKDRRSVVNQATDATCPAEATLDGIIELAMLSRKFRSLFGVPKAQQNITPEYIIKQYTV